MEYVLMVVAGVVGLAIGIAGGLWIGGMVANRRSWVYWLLNVLVLVVGVLVNYAGLSAGHFWILVGSTAFMGGGFTGLKYGYGRSVGLWKAYDRMMGSDDLPN